MGAGGGTHRHRRRLEAVPLTTNTTFLKRLRIFSAIEGISTLVLFGIAMPLKYMAGYPLAVTVAGSVHGLLFMGLALAITVAVERVPLPPKLAAAALIGAVLPFGPFLLDHKLAALATPSDDTPSDDTPSDGGAPR